MSSTPLRSVIAQQVSKLLDLEDHGPECPPPALKYRSAECVLASGGWSAALRHFNGSHWASLSTTSAGSCELPLHSRARQIPQHQSRAGTVSRPSTPSRGTRSPGGGSGHRVGSQADVDRVVRRLHTEHSAARAASRDRLAKEYDHELSRTVTGRPQVDPRSRKMASDVPSIALRSSKLLSAREASIADHKERLGREEGIRHTPVINRRSRSLARTRKDLDTWAEEVRRRREQRQAQCEAEMKAVCTFAPNIYSRRGHKPGQEGAVGNRLLRAAEVSKAKIEEKRKAIESARMREATFAPKITPYPSHKNRDPTGLRQRAGTRQSPSIQGMYRKDGMAAKQCYAEEAFTGTPPVGPDRAPMQGDSAGAVSNTRQSASRQSPDRATINRWCEEVTAPSPSSFPVHAGSHLLISGSKQDSPFVLGRLRSTEDEADSVEDFSPLRRIFQLTADFNYAA